MEQNTYREEIRLAITEICENWELIEPKTLPSAGRLIAEYISVDVAIELFEGAMKEVEDDMFKHTAYKATLFTLNQMKH